MLSSSRSYPRRMNKTACVAHHAPILRNTSGKGLKPSIIGFKHIPPNLQAPIPGGCIKARFVAHHATIARNTCGKGL
eukprot:875594-Pelagomonas_calceolata.AAC.3